VDGQEDHGEALLHLRVLVELVEDDLRLGTALEFNDDAHAVAIGFVADVGDLIDDLFVHELGDAFDELGLVDLVGDLGDDELLAVVAHVFNGDLGAHEEASAAGLVGVGDAAAAVEEATGGEVGTLHVLHNFKKTGSGVVDHLDGGVEDFGEIVWRDVGRHADGDAGRTVDDEVRDARGEDGGLRGGLVVVGHEVDRVEVDVGEHLAGDPGHAGFGVTHGGGGITVDGAEVTLAIDHGVAEREGLRKANHGVVDSGVAVRMVLAHGVADDLGALGVLLVEVQAHLMHGKEDAAMHGLEAVADIGQSAADDDRHGVVEVRAAHLLFNVDGDEVSGAGAGESVVVGLGRNGELGVLIVCHGYHHYRCSAGGKTGWKSGWFGAKLCLETP